MEIILSDLSPKAKESRIRQFFGGTPANVELLHDRKGNFLRMARVTFTTVEAWTQGLLLSGEDLDGRPVVLSVMQGGQRVTLYFKVSDMARDITEDELVSHFRPHTQDGDPVVCMPKARNINKGYAFCYVKSVNDLNSCLAQTGTTIGNGNRHITITPGLFPGGRGRRCA